MRKKKSKSKPFANLSLFSCSFAYRVYTLHTIICKTSTRQPYLDLIGAHLFYDITVVYHRPAELTDFLKIYLIHYNY